MPLTTRLRALVHGDPRHAQIAVLSALALWGAVVLDFEVEAPGAGIILAAALATQWIGARTRGIAFDWRSPAISGLSLVLLFRSDALWLGAVAAMVAVGSKFLLQRDGKHVFNPTNFALVAMLLVSDRVWISPGQWGSGVVLAAALVGAACWVLPRARGDVTIAFALAWAGLLFGRAAWLGDPVAIPLHQLQNGGLLLFAGFMISDPRTVPDTRNGRIAFALLVASAAYVLRFSFYEPDALLYALVGAALTVPVIDRVWHGERFRWPGPSVEPSPGMAVGGRARTFRKTLVESRT